MTQCCYLVSQGAAEVARITVETEIKRLRQAAEVAASQEAGKQVVIMALATAAAKVCAV